MQIFRHFDSLPEDVRGASVAIGNFDGVHLGHQAVILKAGRAAAAIGAPWGVLTFEPHPGAVFNVDDPPFRLTPYRIKARHIEALDVDFLVVLHFDKKFSRVTAADFVTDVLVGGLAVKHVVSGFDFVFGHNRQGDGAFLERAGTAGGFGASIVQAIPDASGEAISSTRIRKCLTAGDPLGAARLLGRDYEIEGRVIIGDERGRTIGFPTANIVLDENIRPATGVYAVRAGIDVGAGTVWHDGVANFGYRPTVGGKGVLFETHIFDFSDDIYGRHLRVALVDFIRPETKFSGLDELKAQIAADCGQAKRILAARTNDGTAEE